MRVAGRSGRRGRPWRWGALLLLLLPACMFVHGSIRQEDALDAEKVKGIVAGKTRRADLLALLGPPEAIVRKGEGAAPPLPPPAAPSPYPVPRGAADPDPAQGGAWGERQGYLALFADRSLTERHGVYYYSSSRLVFTGGFFLFAAEDSRRLVRDRLWVLVQKYPTNL